MIIPSASAETANVTPPDSPFITIDPIGDHAIGEVFFINGTTNLPPSDKLRMGIFSSVIKRGDKFTPWVGANRPGEYATIAPIAITTSAFPGLNQWSVNLTDISKTLISQEYVVYIYSNDTQIDTHFTLLPGNSITISTVLQTTNQSPAPIQSATHAVMISPTTQATPLTLELPIVVFVMLIFLRPFNRGKHD